MILVCLSDGEYIKLPGQSKVRAIWIGNTYCLLKSSHLLKPNDRLVSGAIFGGGVPDILKQIFLIWLTLSGMLSINTFKESIKFRKAASCR